MPLTKGTASPDFELPGTSGATFRLADHAGQAFVLYFFPRSYTPGCTAEACGFRDSYPIFQAKGINIVGITQDNLDTLRRFQESLSLPFELLSDRDCRVANLYRTTVPMIRVTRRTTYLLDSEHVIQSVFVDLFNGELHLAHLLKQMTV